MSALSKEDIRFFKREGYLIKRGILDIELMACAREAFWAAAPPQLKRDAPDTWSLPLPECRELPSHMGGHIWKYRDLGSEDWMIELLPQNPQIWAMAEQFLGAGTLCPPERLRGIYATFPEGDHPSEAPTCHCEGHPFHLGVVGYIDRVLPEGGGLKVWPGSHQRILLRLRRALRRNSRREIHPRHRLFRPTAVRGLSRRSRRYHLLASPPRPFRGA